MGKKKESMPRANEEREDPILLALKYRWIQLPCGILVPGKTGK